MQVREKGEVQLSSATNKTLKRGRAIAKGVKSARQAEKKRLQKDQNGDDIPDTGRLPEQT